MNKGTANKVTLFIIPKILIGMLLNIEASNTPKGMQAKANNMETPDKVNATGYPSSNMVHIKIIKIKGIISMAFLKYSYIEPSKG
jgi:hypothetical protein